MFTFEVLFCCFSTFAANRLIGSEVTLSQKQIVEDVYSQRRVHDPFSTKIPATRFLLLHLNETPSCFRLSSPRTFAPCALPWHQSTTQTGKAHFKVRKITNCRCLCWSLHRHENRALIVHDSLLLL